jgi:hypothetical protein
MAWIECTTETSDKSSGRSIPASESHLYNDVLYRLVVRLGESQFDIVTTVAVTDWFEHKEGATQTISFSNYSWTYNHDTRQIQMDNVPVKI